MHTINYFGMTFVVDKATNVVLHSSRSNETAKFIVSSILDTAAVQHSDFITRQLDPNWLTDKAWIVHVGSGKFSEYIQEITDDLRIKREIAYRRARGYHLLLEQATIIGCSYDNLSDLSTDDLPMFYLFKDRYIQEFSESTNLSIESAGKHLNFLAESLVSVHFRKQKLIWKYSRTLRQVNTESEFITWRNSVLKETVGLGQV